MSYLDKVGNISKIMNKRNQNINGSLKHGFGLEREIVILELSFTCIDGMVCEGKLLMHSLNSTDESKYCPHIKTEQNNC